MREFVKVVTELTELPQPILRNSVRDVVVGEHDPDVLRCQRIPRCCVGHRSPDEDVIQLVAEISGIGDVLAGDPTCAISDGWTVHCDPVVVVQVQVLINPPDAIGDLAHL